MVFQPFGSCEQIACLALQLLIYLSSFPKILLPIICLDIIQVAVS